MLRQYSTLAKERADEIHEAHSTTRNSQMGANRLGNDTVYCMQWTYRRQQD